MLDSTPAIASEFPDGPKNWIRKSGPHGTPQTDLSGSAPASPVESPRAKTAAECPGRGPARPPRHPGGRQTSDLYPDEEGLPQGPGTRWGPRDPPAGAGVGAPQTCLPRPGPAPPTAKKRERLAQPSLLALHRPGGASRHLPLPGLSPRARGGPRSATEFAMTLVTLSFCTPQTWVDVQCLSFSCTNAAPSLPHPSPPPGGPFPAPGPWPQALVPRRPARTGKRGRATQTKPLRGLKSLKTYQPLSRSPVQP